MNETAILASTPLAPAADLAKQTHGGTRWTT